MKKNQMSEILEDPSPASLIKAIRSNTYDYLIRRARLLDSEVHIEKDQIWTFETSPARRPGY